MKKFNAYIIRPDGLPVPCNVGGRPFAAESLDELEAQAEQDAYFLLEGTREIREDEQLVFAEVGLAKDQEYKTTIKTWGEESEAAADREREEDWKKYQQGQEQKVADALRASRESTERPKKRIRRLPEDAPEAQLDLFEPHDAPAGRR